MRHLTRGERGFTLLEVVVALTVAAISLPVLLQSFSEGTKKQAAIENKTTAMYLLRLRMSEIEMQDVLETGTDSGEFGTNSRFAWESEIAETDEDGLYSITVTVSWRERGHDKKVELTAYLADRNIQQEENSNSL